MQNPGLFKGTIEENLKWGKADATQEELWQALEVAQAREFVEEKNGKLQAEITQGGKNLSGGQKQRLTIARALIGNPEILILDDSASALDYTTDYHLRHALKELSKELTVVVVSQRASAVLHADKILVLEDGTMAGLGTHDELIKTCEIYQEIYFSQFDKEEKA
jgi:ATP-binding cassette subfamily B protein